MTHQLKGFQATERQHGDWPLEHRCSHGQVDMSRQTLHTEIEFDKRLPDTPRVTSGYVKLLSVFVQRMRNQCVPLTLYGMVLV
jgi:hypothetical protein